MRARRERHWQETAFSIGYMMNVLHECTCGLGRLWLFRTLRESTLQRNASKTLPPGQLYTEPCKKNQYLLLTMLDKQYSVDDLGWCGTRWKSLFMPCSHQFCPKLDATVVVEILPVIVFLGAGFWLSGEPRQNSSSGTTGYQSSSSQIDLSHNYKTKL